MSATVDSSQLNPSNSSASSNKRRWLWGILVLVVVAGALWFGHWWLVGRYVESTDDAYLQADNASVAPKISGYVAEVYVKDNQSVNAGDVLLRLDADNYQAKLDQANATIAARQADLQRAEAELTQRQSDLEQVKAQHHVAELSLQHARTEVKRYEPLAAAGAASKERLTSLINTRDQAQATVAANVALVASAQAQVRVAKTAIEQARSQLVAAQASAHQADLDVKDTVVRAATSGRVGDRTVRVGQFVQPGTRVMTLVPVQDVYLVANFKETQIGRMRPGQPVTLHVDALPDAEVHGVVDSLAPGTGAQFALLPPENATGNFTKIVQRVPVRIRIDPNTEARARLLPGLSVTAEVDTRDEGQAADHTAVQGARVHG